MFKRIIVAAGIALVALPAGLSTTSFVLAGQQGPKETLILKKSFGAWEYRALQSDRANAAPEIVLSIESSLKGKANLARLLNQQKAAKDRLFQVQPQISAAIIPTRPLATSSLSDFATKHGITVTSYKIIARASNGELVTIFGAPEGTTLFPEQNLQTMVQGIEHNTQTSLQILGIVAIDAQISKAAFTSMERDSEVLGVDLTTALALEDLSREKQIDPAKVQVIASPLYWASIEEN